MPTEHTLSILKPDATRRNLTGKINAVFEEQGLRIVAQKRVQLSQVQAETFYAEHKERGFFAGMIATMIAGPVVLQVLAGDDAIAHHGTEPSGRVSVQWWHGWSPLVLFPGVMVMFAPPGWPE